MGIGIIFSVIIGIMMTITAGTQVLPSYIEKTKIAKVENRTIANQNTIKEAIFRYIEVNNKLPKKMEQLQEVNYIKDYHLDNLFGGTYSFKIDKKELIIYTNILDDNATKYFKNTTKFPNKPTCVELIGETCKDNLWKTVYPFDKTITNIDNNTQPSDHFSKENLGKKEYHEDNPPKMGDIDHVVPDENGNIVEVYECTGSDCATNPDSWTKKGEDKVVDGGIGSKTGVFISNLPIPYHVWNEETNQLKSTSEQHEKVHCNPKSIGKEVFVVNQNTGLGEFVWVAPAENSVSKLQTKIFGDNIQSIRQNANNIIGDGIKYKPNNICTSNVQDMNNMFSETKNFDQPLNRWDTSSVADMDRMFYRAKNFNQPLNFNTSNVTDTNLIFYYATSFNQPLNFNTSNVTDMSGMFYLASVFNQPLNFNTSNVTNMSVMFASASVFNQPLDSWDTSNVQSMSGMFDGAENFNQSLNSFDTSNMNNMFYMFYNATNFNNGCINDDMNCPLDFNTSNVTDMSNMFSSATSFNQSLNSLDTSNVQSMSWMFENATNFNNGCINDDMNCPLDFNTSNVTDMFGMFYFTGSFNQPIDKWNTSNVTDMSVMFANASVFNQPLDSWDTSNVTGMAGMFDGAENFNQSLNSFDTSNVEYMNTMFYDATNFNNGCINDDMNCPLDFNTSNVTDMSYMFENANAFNQELNFDTSNVIDMNYMFYWATNFNNGCINDDMNCPLDFNTSNVTGMSGMFLYATSFNQPLDSWDTSNVQSMSVMFANASVFNQPLDSWDTSNVQYMSAMFKDAKNFNQDISSWEVSNVEYYESFARNSALTSENAPSKNGIKFQTTLP